MAVDNITSLAFLNTDVAASFAAVVWLLLAWIFEKKPKFVGLLTGAVAGLATITPAAGYVTTTSAVIIGCLASVICYLAVSLKNRLGWDDALDVWGVHGVGGVVGVICLGIFGSTLVNGAGTDGLLRNGMDFFLLQSGVAIGAAAYAFVSALVLLWIINLFCRVRLTKEEEETGLDSILHGEAAYEDIT